MGFGHELAQRPADQDLLRQTVELLPHFKFAHLTRSRVTTIHAAAVGYPFTAGKKIYQPKVLAQVELPVNLDDPLDYQHLRVVDHEKGWNLAESTVPVVLEQTAAYVEFVKAELTPHLLTMFTDPAFAQEQERWESYARPLLYEALADVESAKRRLVEQCLGMYSWSISAIDSSEYTSRSTGSLGNLQTEAAMRIAKLSTLCATLEDVAGEFINPRKIAHKLLDDVKEPELWTLADATRARFLELPLRRTLRD